MPRTSVLLVDDCPIFLEHTNAWLSRARDIEVVGSASSGAEAIQLVQRLKPRIVLMDLDMPDMSGLEATRWLKRLPDAPAVLMLTFHGEPAYRAAAAAAGAEGFLCKADFAKELLPSLRRICSEAAERGEAQE